MYNIIYADPPWKYSNEQGKDPARGGMPYNTMSVEELVALPLPDICAPDCLLFLWVTMPKLIEGLRVMEGWGFDYRTCAFTWVKLNPTGSLIIEGKDVILKRGVFSGLGYWTNGNAELCLLGKKGKPKRVARNVKQVVLAPRSTHSTKPAEVRDRIVSLCGDLPRVELFAREKSEGWDVWGSEVESSISLWGEENGS